MNRLVVSAFVLTSLFWTVGSSAQTANSSPTAPAPGGASGSPPAASTTGPSGGTPGADAGPLRRADQGSGETETERRERIRQDKAMTICKGC